ncbi:hypothetical protein M0P65_02425 [Candidatus Gracilibacteria bacterium]|nr:hypothetical protein [Candidatus Gracilibacteria bacterium]
MKNNKNGSALIIAIFVTMIITIIGIFLLNKIIPLSKNVKGIENSNIAYYNANSGVEEALLYMSSSDPSRETTGTGGNTVSSYNYKLTANTSIIPLSGEGNSEYDKNFNKIGIGQPIQLVINNNSISWNNVIFNFKVPDLNGNGNESLSNTSSGVINWILSGSGTSAFASGETNMIKGSEVNGVNWKIGGKNGMDLNGSGGTFSQFYTQFGCSILNKCTLKLSVINPLLLSNGQIAPYLEYKIDFLGSTIPNQYSKIESNGNAFGFKRTIKRNVEQLTSNEAMDFTVFQ